MRRGLWFVAGAGAGVYAVLRGRRAAEALSADGLSDRINAAVLGARMFRDEVAQGAAEKESQLRDRLAVAPHDGATERRLTSRTENQTGNTTEQEESSS